MFRWYIWHAARLCGLIYINSPAHWAGARNQHPVVVYSFYRLIPSLKRLRIWHLIETRLRRTRPVIPLFDVQRSVGGGVSREGPTTLTDLHGVQVPYIAHIRVRCCYSGRCNQQINDGNYCRGGPSFGYNPGVLSKLGSARYQLCG